MTAAYLSAIALSAKLSGVPEPIPKIIGGLALACYFANITTKM